MQSKLSLTGGRHRAAPLFSVLLLGPVAAARADVKIVSEVNVTRQPDANDPSSPSFPETVTTYYKGRYARVEVAGGPVTIYNADAGRVYTLDPDKKTYYVLPLKQVQEGETRLAAEEPAGANLDAKVDVKPPDGAETRTIAGLIAKEYDVSGSIRVKPRESGGGGLLGGIFGGGGGGFPGGGFPGAAASPVVAAITGVAAGEAAVGAAVVKVAGSLPARRSAVRSGCLMPSSCQTTRKRLRCQRCRRLSSGAGRPSSR